MLGMVAAIMIPAALAPRGSLRLLRCMDCVWTGYELRTKIRLAVAADHHKP
jgi:hypothetical protein